MTYRDNSHCAVISSMPEEIVSRFVLTPVRRSRDVLPLRETVVARKTYRCIRMTNLTPSESTASSPYATGGGGVDLETDVVVYYLAAALTRSIARGLPDAIVHTVPYKRRDEASPSTISSFSGRDPMATRNSRSK